MIINKPRLRKVYRTQGRKGWVWLCVGNGTHGNGPSPRKAWMHWKANVFCSYPLSYHNVVSAALARLEAKK